MFLKINQKWVFASLIAFSIFSFIFVNVKENNCPLDASKCSELVQKEQMKEEKEETGKFAVPDLTVLEKVVRLVEKYAGR